MNLGIVGVGAISHRYFRQAGPDKRATIVATCAQRLESAEAKAHEHGIDAWFDDYTTMYDTARPEAVVVVTPTVHHAAPVIAALERGIHVLCEKPMATTWEDCQAMVAAAERNDAVFLCLPYDAKPLLHAALAHLNEETLGKFTGAESQWNWAGLPPGPPWDGWYHDRSVSGGAIDTLVYPVSRVVSLLGPAKRVAGMASNLIPRRIVSPETTVESDIDDNITLTIEWESGQQAVLRTLWGTSVFANDTVVYGRHGTLWMSGHEVIVHSPRRPLPGAEAETWRGFHDCYRFPVAPVPFDDEGLLDHFVDCIEGIAQPTCGGRQALHVNEILLKGYEAARSGTTQELETTFTPWHSVDPAFYDTRSQPV